MRSFLAPLALLLYGVAVATSAPAMTVSVNMTGTVDFPGAPFENSIGEGFTASFVFDTGTPAQDILGFTAFSAVSATIDNYAFTDPLIFLVEDSSGGDFLGIVENPLTVIDDVTSLNFEDIDGTALPTKQLTDLLNLNLSDFESAIAARNIGPFNDPIGTIETLAVTVVPLPASLPMLLSVIGGLALLRRRCAARAPRDAAPA